MEQEIQELKEEVKLLREDINKLITICSRMDNHITFVDNVYDSVRIPVQSIFTRLRLGISVPENIPQNTIQNELLNNT